MTQIKLKYVLSFLLLWILLSVSTAVDFGSVATKFIDKSICVPKTVTWELSWIVENAGNETIYIEINWGDEGEKVEQYSTKFGSNRVKKIPDPDSNNRYGITVTHQYAPYKGDNCKLVASAWPVCNNTKGTKTTNDVKVFDVDNQHGGVILPSSPVEYVCVGDKNVTIGFTDNSIWNCTKGATDGVESNQYNGYNRWTQWLYGIGDTSPDIDSEIRINNKKWNNKPIDGTVLPHKPKADESKPSVYKPTVNISSNDIFIPEAKVSDVGKVFELKLNNWNVCNAYPDGKDAVFGKCRIVFIDKPNPIIDTIIICDDEVYSLYDSELVSNYDELYKLNTGGLFPDSVLVNGDAKSNYGYWSGNFVEDNKFKGTKSGGGFHHIKYTSLANKGGCETEVEAVVQVIPAPVFPTDRQNFLGVCPGTVLDLKSTVDFNGDKTKLTYVWDKMGSPTKDGTKYLDSKTTIDSRFTSPMANGLYGVKLFVKYPITDKRSCSDAKSYRIYVGELKVDLPDSIFVCQGDPLVIKPTITNIKPAGDDNTYRILSHKWTGDVSNNYGGTSRDSLQFRTTTVGNYTIVNTVQDSRNCVASDNVVVKVLEKPVAKIITNNISVCGNTLRVLTKHTKFKGTWHIVSKPTNGNATFKPIGYNPNSGTVDTTQITITKYGEYKFDYFVNNRICEDVATITLTFVPIPYPNAGKDAFICGNEISINASGTADKTYWAEVPSNPGKATFATPTNKSTKVTVPIDKPGVYQFVWCLQNGNLCLETDTVAITFIRKPIADFKLDFDEGCSPVLVKPTNKSKFYDEALWTSDVAASSTEVNPSYEFTNYSDATVLRGLNLKVSETTYNMCSDEKSVQIKVHPGPIAKFSTDYKASCSPVVVSFKNESERAVKYTWSFPEGDIITSKKDTAIAQSFAVPEGLDNISSFLIKLTTENSLNCVSEDSMYITVFPSKQDTFRFSSNPICAGDQVRITATGGAKTYNWELGNGFNNTDHYVSVDATYLNNGNSDVNYTVKLNTISPFGCTSSFSDVLLVHPAVIADFSLTDTTGYKELLTTTVDNSTNATSLVWNWGDNSKRDTTLISSPNTSHTYYNNYFQKLIYDVNLTATNDAGCRATATKMVEVKPAFNIDFSCITSGCSPLEVKFTNNSKGVYTMKWDFDDGSPVETDYLVNHTFVHDSTLGSVPDTFSVKLVGKAFWGESDSIIKKIIVYPSPKANWEANVVGEDSIDFKNISQGASSYKWDFNGDKLEEQTHGETHRIGFDIGDFVSTIAAQLIAKNDQCSDTMQLLTTVNPVVKANFVVDNGCSPWAANFNATSSRGALKYWWRIGNGELEARGNKFNEVFENKSDSAIDIPVTLVIEGVIGGMDSILKYVTVYPTPIADFEAIDRFATKTNLAITNTTIHTQNDKNYWWFGDGEALVSDSSTIYHTYIDSTEAPLLRELMLKVDNNYKCTDSVIKPLMVYPEVIADFIGDTVGCAPYKCSFKVDCKGASIYNWTFNDGYTAYGNKVVRILDNLTDSIVHYKLTLIATSSYGFADTVSRVISVYPEVIANFSIQNTEDRFVTPFELKLKDESTHAAIVNWNIDTLFSVGVVDSIFGTTLTTDDNFRAVTVYQKVESGICFDSTSQVFNLYPSVKADFAIDSLCSPIRIDMKSMSTGASHFQWFFSDDSSFWNKPIAPHTFEKNETSKNKEVEVTLVATSSYGISDTVKHKMVIYPTPLVDFTCPYSGFTPFEVLFDNRSKNVDRYVWSFGDGETRDTPLSGDFKHTYNLLGNDAVVYNVNLIGTTKDNCEATAMRQIEVAPTVEAVILPDSIVGCAPLSVVFNTQVEPKIVYEWDFGDGSTPLRISGATHTFENNTLKDTAFRVQLIATSKYGYSDTTYQNITVRPRPIADFEILETSACAELPITFVNTTKGATSSVWTFGSSIPERIDSTVVDYKFINITKYASYPDVVLQVSNGVCSSKLQKAVEVMPSVTASFTCDSVGCSPMPVFFKNTSLNSTVYAWDFGDGSTSDEINPLHIYQNTSNSDTTFTVTLIADNGYEGDNRCFRTTTFDILVHPEPDFTLSVSADEIAFPNATIGASANIKNDAEWEYTWNFGDGTDITNSKTTVVHDYHQSGGYKISLTVQNGFCEMEQSKNINVYPGEPTAVFSGAVSGCSPHTVNFLNESFDFVAVMWDFGDGYIDGEENATHTFLEPGKYNVNLIVYNAIGMTDTAVAEVNVYPGVTAYFLATPNKISSFAQKVNLRNLSLKADNFFWNFDDGMTSTEKEPIISYHKEGLKDISLIASSVNGCSDTMIQTAAIDVSESHRIALPNAFVPSKNSAGGGFEDGATDVFYPFVDETKIVEYTFQVFNRWGQMLFESHDCTVGWDGYYKGVLSPQDVYVYKVKVLFDDGSEEVETGDVTLFR